MKPSPEKLAEIAHVEATLIGRICDRCGAHLFNVHFTCSAKLDERCPGFEAIYNAKRALHAHQTAVT